MQHNETPLGKTSCNCQGISHDDYLLYKNYIKKQQLKTLIGSTNRQKRGFSLESSWNVSVAYTEKLHGNGSRVSKS